MRSSVILAGTAAQGAPQAYRESIAGTVVSFEMVPVPGGTVTVAGQTVEVKPFLIGRTEVTWDMYDVFALGLDTPKSGEGADAIARPSQPYGAPDYGWGHAGYPVISVTPPGRAGVRGVALGQDRQEVSPADRGRVAARGRARRQGTRPRLSA